MHFNGIRNSLNEKLSIKTETPLLVNNNNLLKKKINLQIEKDKIFSEIKIKKEKCEIKDTPMFEVKNFSRQRQINNTKEKINLPNEEKNVSAHYEGKIKTIKKEQNDVVSTENFFDDLPCLSTSFPPPSNLN